MKTRVLRNKEIEFKKISYVETEEVGTFFRINERCSSVSGGDGEFMDFYDVLMILNQDHLQEFEGGELVLNLSKSKIVFIPFVTKIILLNNTNETVFEEIMYEEPKE